MNLTKLDTYGNETFSQKFTQPLRAVLGGRKITVLAVGGFQEEKIYTVAQRILAALALLTIGLLYTIPATIVLLFSPKRRVLNGSITKHEGDSPAMARNTTKTKSNAVTVGAELENVLFESIKGRAITFSKQHLATFRQRGGIISIIDKHNPIVVSRDERIVVGCTSGVNRSQALRSVLIEGGCKNVADYVIAGGDSAINPDCEMHILNPHQEEDNTQFREAFAMNKARRWGETSLQNAEFLEGSQQKEKERFYQREIAREAPTHYLTFASSGPTMIQRLVESKKNLSGFKVSFIPWNDEIAHPNSGANSEINPAPNSAEAFIAFAQKLRNAIQIN